MSLNTLKVILAFALLITYYGCIRNSYNSDKEENKTSKYTSLRMIRS